MVATTSIAQATENEKRMRKTTLEKVKANHLSRQLQMRLQYARLKVEHGWQRQSLNEVENLYFHSSHLRGPKTLPTPATVTVQQPVPEPAQSSLSFKLAPANQGRPHTADDTNEMSAQDGAQPTVTALEPPNPESMEVDPTSPSPTSIQPTTPVESVASGQNLVANHDATVSTTSHPSIIIQPPTITPVSATTQPSTSAQADTTVQPPPSSQPVSLETTEKALSMLMQMSALTTNPSPAATGATVGNGGVLQATQPTDISGPTSYYPVTTRPALPKAPSSSRAVHTSTLTARDMVNFRLGGSLTYDSFWSSHSVPAVPGRLLRETLNGASTNSSDLGPVLYTTPGYRTHVPSTAANLSSPKPPAPDSAPNETLPIPVPP